MRTWTYSAYGLVLRSTFALPGMRAVEADGEPELALTHADERELLEGWDATAAKPVCTEVLSDGERFSIERSPDGAHLYRYGEAATFRLREDARRLECAVSETRSAEHSRAPTWLRVLLGSVLAPVSVLRGFEALHASAVQWRDGIVAFIAPRGGGKSTLAAEFARRGTALVCDDALVLHRDGGTVWAHPGPPHLNLALPADSRVVATSIGVTMATFGNEAWVAAGRSSVDCRPVTGVCLLERGAGRRAQLLPAPANPLIVLPYALAMDDRLDRARERFALCGDLAAGVPMYRLRAPAGVSARELADLVEAGLSRSLPRRGRKLAV